jgi:hypothetical protein
MGDCSFSCKKIRKGGKRRAKITSKVGFGACSRWQKLRETKCELYRWGNAVVLVSAYERKRERSFS